MSTATTRAVPGRESPKQDAPKIPSGATVAVVDEDVWRVRHLSELLQKNGFRVLLLTSPNNALQLVDTRCDVVLIAESLKALPADELGQALREKHGEKRPWLLLLDSDGLAARESFDVTVARATEDDALVPLLIEAGEARRACTAAPVPAAAPAGDLET